MPANIYRYCSHPDHNNEPVTCIPQLLGSVTCTLISAQFWLRIRVRIDVKFTVRGRDRDTNTGLGLGI